MPRLALVPPDPEDLNPFDELTVVDPRIPDHVDPIEDEPPCTPAPPESQPQRAYPRGRWRVAAVLAALLVAIGALVLGRQLLTQRREGRALAGHVAELQAAAARAGAERSDLEQRLAGGVRERALERSRLEERARALEEQIEAAQQAGIHFNLLETIRFTRNSAALTPPARAALTRLGVVFGLSDGSQLLLEGHADEGERGARSSWDLAAARAIAVTRFLVDQVGVDPARVVVLSHGRYRRAADADAPQGRVEIVRSPIVLAHQAQPPAAQQPQPAPQAPPRPEAARPNIPAPEAATPASTPGEVPSVPIADPPLPEPATEAQFPVVPTQ